MKANVSNTIKTCYKRMVNILFGLLPFKNKMIYIRTNYNGTIMILFEVIRFLFLMSLFAFIIFLYLNIYHFTKVKNKTKCKYGFSCIFFYSSFTEKEFHTYSITVGIWVFFFFTFSLMFFFILKSGFYQINIYNKTNKNALLTSFIFNSWDFNIRKEDDAEILKFKIKDESLDYTHVAINYVEPRDPDDCCVCDCKCNKYVALVISIIISFFLIIFYFVYLTFCFKMKNNLSKQNTVKKKRDSKDGLGDFVCYLLIAIGMNFFPFLVSLTTKIETWTKLSKKIFSETIKRTITTIMGFIYLIFIFLYFTLQNHSKDDFAFKFLVMDEPTFFGCPGKFEIPTSTITGSTKFKDGEYSKCREEEVGLNFFILSLVYLFVDILKAILSCIKNCCCSCRCCRRKKGLTYQPFLVLLHVYSVAILFGLTLPFMPFAVIFFPIVMFIEFQIQYKRLIKNGRYNYDATNVGTISNSQLMLNSFCAFNILTLVSFAYFYVIQIPHFNNYSCEYVGDKTYLIEGSNSLCGPASDLARMSYGMSYKILQNGFFGFFYSLLREGALFFVLVAIILVSLICRKNGPSENYFDDIIKREEQILSTFQLLYSQVAKRNVINAQLLKIVKKKEN
jgi:hypothetical protein